MTASILHEEPTPGVHHLILNRPEVRNALGVREYALLAGVLDSLRGDDCSAIVISGRGPVFCAGNELGEFKTAWPQPAHGPVYRFLAALHACPSPVIAAVQGAAIGIGATMLLNCDLVIAHETAKLRFPFADLGISLEGGSSLLLAQAIGTQRALDLALTGRPVPAHEARDIGLVTQVVAEDPAAVALTHARAMAAKPQGALRAIKAQVKAGRAAVLPALFEEEIQTINRLLKERPTQA